jgi:hypothetical protein
VFIGFFVFAVVFFVLVQVGGRSSDGTVVLVATAGLCWLIVAGFCGHTLSPPAYTAGFVRCGRNRHLIIQVQLTQTG